MTGKIEDIAGIRYKLGERSRKLGEHTAQIMFYNDRTGEWLRDSAFSDTGVLAQTIFSLDPSLERPIENALLSSAVPATELPGQAIFVKACASCHSIGKGQRVGPDLKDITKRRERSWVARYVQSPERMRNELDPIAVDLKARFPAVRMPNLQVSEADVSDLLSYIDARSSTVMNAEGDLPINQAQRDQAVSETATTKPLDHGAQRH